MKNIQIIDGASNSTRDVFEVPDGLFALIFPNDTDVAFVQDLIARKIPNDILRDLYARKADKKLIKGIHGTLHLEYSEADPNAFPDRKEDSAVATFAHRTVAKQ